MVGRRDVRSNQGGSFSNQGIQEAGGIDGVPQAAQVYNPPPLSDGFYGRDQPGGVPCGLDHNVGPHLRDCLGVGARCDQKFKLDRQPC